VRRLVVVELRRFSARHAVHWLLAALLLGIVIAGITMAATSSRDLSGARRDAEKQRIEMTQNQQSEEQDCLTHVPPGAPPDACDFGAPPPVEAFLSDPRFSFRDHVRDLVRTGIVLGALVALLLSASFIGAEWQAGTFASLLTWDPRRPLVAMAKFTAAAVCSVAIAAMTTAGLVGVAALVAATRGTFHSVLQDAPPDSRMVSDVWPMAGRGVALVVVLSLVGAGLAMLLRHTVAALGVVIGYVIVAEGILGQLRDGDVRHHLFQSRFAALLNGEYSWIVPVRSGGGFEFDPSHRHVVHAAAAGSELAAVVLILLLVTLHVLQRRDVT
jgi:ABC-2 type transport system permease protein